MAKSMKEQNGVNAVISPPDKDLNRLSERVEPVLKAASDICGVPAAFIYLHRNSDFRLLASYGVSDKPVTSAIKKLTGLLEPGNGLSIIQKVREHKQAGSLLSDSEMEEIRFFAGVKFESETGSNIGALCIFDYNTRELSEDQKQRLRVIADGAKAHLMLYKQGELLDESSEKLKTFTALLKNSADLSFLLEPESGKITDASKGVEKVLGYSPESLRGKLFTDIVESGEPEDETQEHWFSAEKQQRGRYSTSIRLIDRQGSKRWFLCNFSSDEDQWYVTARDISEKKEAELGIYKLKDKLQNIVSVATDLIYELDWASGDLSWGDELTDVLGYPHTEQFVDYDWWLDKIHPDDLEGVIHDVALTVEGESQKMNLVYRIRTFDGSYKYVMNRNYVDRNEDGSPGTIIGAVVDVSELVKIKEQSYRNKKLLEELGDKAWSAMWIRDDEGTFVFANNEFRALFGLSGKKVVGKNVHDLFDDKLASQFKVNDQKSLETGDPVVFDEKLEVNGKERYYKTNIYPIRGVPGLKNIVGGVSIDVTEEKETQELIEKSLEEKNVLLAEIHHRVKNNLAIVSSMMYLQAYKEPDERVQQKLYDSTVRIQTMAMIHELLYKSSSFKHLRIDKNIEQLITNITGTFSISIDLDVSYDMEPIELNINNAIPCSLIVNEVVTNALKHAYSDGDSGKLDVFLGEEDETVTLKIRDDGKGFSDDFDEADDGTTLGLELIQTLTKQLNGTYFYTPMDHGVEFELIFDKSEGRGVGSNLK